MSVLITAVVPGQTQEGYDATMAILRPLLEQAKGFIAHGAGMSPEGWRDATTHVSGIALAVGSATMMTKTPDMLREAR